MGKVAGFIECGVISMMKMKEVLICPPMKNKVIIGPAKKVVPFLFNMYEYQLEKGRLVKA